MKKIKFSLLIALVLSFGIISCNDDNDIRVRGIIISETEITLTVGEEKELNAKIEPSDATNKSMLWKSKNKEIVTVDKGKIKALAKGSTKVIVVSAEGLFSDSVVIIVNETAIKVESITLKDKDVSLKMGESQIIDIEIKPKNATEKIIWKSSNEKVVIVENGKITALSAGTANITASTEGKISDMMKVTVSPFYIAGDYRAKITQGDNIIDPDVLVSVEKKSESIIHLTTNINVEGIPTIPIEGDFNLSELNKDFTYTITGEVNPIVKIPMLGDTKLKVQIDGTINTQGVIDLGIKVVNMGVNFKLEGNKKE